jgi:hypothetical protein
MMNEKEENNMCKSGKEGGEEEDETKIKKSMCFCMLHVLTFRHV